MPKVTLDMTSFKALASDTRLDILRALDGKKMSLKDISRVTKLNKATLHEHLQKLHEAGLVKKKEREGHKWVYYKLSWKGEGLLHPENTRIVIMFSTSFFALFLAVVLIVSFTQPITVGIARTYGDTTFIYEAESEGNSPFYRSYNYNYLETIESENQTLDSYSVTLQSNKQAQNALGITYDPKELKWKEVPETSIDVGSSFELYECSKFDNLTDRNITEDGNDTDDSDNGKMTVGGVSDSIPPVTELIATVQDVTYLYLAIVCFSFFGAIFIFSSWRYRKNKTPKL